MTSEGDEMEKMSILCKTNTKLCDQVEIFDAISATGTARNDQKATTISQLRGQLEERNKMLQSENEHKPRLPSGINPPREPAFSVAYSQSQLSQDKSQANPTASSFSAEKGPNHYPIISSDPPTTEDDTFERSDTTGLSMLNPYPQRTNTYGKGKDSKDEGFATASREQDKHDPSTRDDDAFGRPAMTEIPAPILSPRHAKRSEMETDSMAEYIEIASRVKDKHASVLHHISTLVSRESNDRTIRCAFLIEYVRIEQWGIRVLPFTRAFGTWEFYERILNRIEKRLSKVVGSKNTSGLPTDLPDQGKLKSQSPWGLSSHRRALFGPSSIEEKEFSVRVETIEDTVHRIKFWNDCIVVLSPRNTQQSLRRQLRIMFSGDIRAELIGSASDLLCYSDLKELARVTMLTQRIASGKPEDNLSILSSSKHNPMWLDTRMFAGPRSSTKSETIEEGTYRGESVVAWWRRDPQKYLSGDLSRKDWRHQLILFSEILNASLVPLEMAILHIIGYLEDMQGRLGCIYRLPLKNQLNGTHTTLSQLLDDAGVGTQTLELGKRFELSTILVKTVHSLHTMGFAHGDISPPNILFWPTASSGKNKDLGKPRLFGFDISNENGPFRYSPICNATSLICNDLLQLGYVLYKVGLWGPLSQPQTYKGSVDPLPEKYDFGELSQRAGKQYGDAVKFCINIPLSYQPVTRETFRMYLNEFQTKVVDPIATCAADENSDEGEREEPLYL